MRRTAPSPRARLAALALAVVLVCSAAAPAALAAPAPSAAAASTAASDAGADRAAEAVRSTSAVESTQSTPPDPASDVIGWEEGYWHNESIDVDQSDGLSDAELKRYVGRAMARVEYIREAEFDSSVPVSVISRAEYRNRSSGGGSGDANTTLFNEWNDQVWEGLFIVGESTGSSRAIGQTTGTSVLGFYSPTRDEITIVTSTPDSPTIDNATLHHELVHALQDQQYNLSNATYRAPTQDGDLATDGVVEGEANYIEDRYIARCGDEWSCVAQPESASAGGGSGGSGGGPNLGVLLTLLNPYSDGPVYVNQLIQEGGWDRFEERFRNPPVSSEQVIHLTDEKPVELNFTDNGTDGWSTFPRDNPRLGQNGSDTVGEASIFSMFWYQAREYNADTIDPRVLFENTDGRHDTYNYNATPSAGWANDRLFPYRNGTGENAEYGYVWKTAWDTEKDAQQFYDAYLRMLEAHDVRKTDAGYYVVPDGPFADAFAVKTQGKQVIVVNGPTVSDVKEIRPGLTPSASATGTPGEASTGSDTEAAGGTAAAEESTAGTPAGGETTETSGAGFGLGVAAAAIALAGLLARRRR